jgi:hypothetical protein
MRQIYTSPRAENIDNVVALMAENGIETTVANRSNYNRRSWQRFSYTQRQDDRESWAQVWVSHADDPTPVDQRQHTVVRARRIALLAVLAAFAMVVLRYLHVV